MDEVRIAFCDGNHWPVAGTKYLKVILEGSEELECSVSFVSCESWTEIIDLWEEPDGDMPWVIHPNIARRLKIDIGSQCERERKPVAS